MKFIYSHCKKSRHVPIAFAVLGVNPLANPGHPEANVSQTAFFTCSDLQRLSNNFAKREPAEAYLSTLAFCDAQKHTVFCRCHAAICATSQHFRVSVQGSVASALWVPLCSLHQGFPWAPWALRDPMSLPVPGSVWDPCHFPGE